MRMSSQLTREGQPAEDLYPAYRQDMAGERLVRSLQTGALVVFFLNSAFIPLDAWAFPDRFPVLLGVRIALDMAMLACWWAAGQVEVGEHILTAGPLIVGAGLIGVIGVAGGVGSNYYPGLMLLFLGMPVLLPLTVGQSTGIVAVLLTGFASLPLATGWNASLQDYCVRMIFPAAAAAECIASCALLDRLRFADFLQRREIEAARDHLKTLDEAKARFSANIHHELRTPLTLILAPLDTLRSGELGSLPAPVEQTLRTMQINGRRLLKMINNLLDLAKVESQQFEVHRRPIDLTRLVDEVIEGARPLAERKGLFLRSEGLEDYAEFVADPDALEKVLVNLVGNALKFTERGGISLIASAGREGGVHLRVRDTGIGLPPGQVERIFDRFAQVDASATRKHEGTGIGLSLAQELVELHGGRIWAQSDGEGQGTTIHVLLPDGESDASNDEEVLRESGGASLRLDQSMAAVEADLGLEESLGQGGTDERMVEMERSIQRWEGREGPAELVELAHGSSVPEVLIAEDNPDMRKLLAFLVGREFRVRLARDGREALDRVRERTPDLVLSDVMMPEMSGTDLCAAIKEDPGLAGIPVVLVTSKAESEMKIEGLEKGADDYVTKPFHPRELMARVRSLVLLRQLQKELHEQNASLQLALEQIRKAEVKLVQSERLAAVGELAAGVAHEVNNPVNFALNAARTLAREVEDVRRFAERLERLDWDDRSKLQSQLPTLERAHAEAGLEESADTIRELSQIVRDGLERTARLVSDLKDFASPGAGPRAEVDLARGVRSTLQLLGRELKDRGVEVETHLPDDLPTVQGDAGALNQVFLNLLKNAAEAMEGQDGMVHVEASAEGGIVAITLRDAGPGIEPDVMDRLFVPFFTTKAAGGGTGLGLSMSRQIAEAHGGGLRVESEPGEGAAFTLTLPTDPLPPERDHPGHREEDEGDEHAA